MLHELVAVLLLLLPLLLFTVMLFIGKSMKRWGKRLLPPGMKICRELHTRTSLASLLVETLLQSIFFVSYYTCHASLSGLESTTFRERNICGTQSVKPESTTMHTIFPTGFRPPHRIGYYLLLSILYRGIPHPLAFFSSLLLLLEMTSPFELFESRSNSSRPLFCPPRCWRSTATTAAASASAVHCRRRSHWIIIPYAPPLNRSVFKARLLITALLVSRAKGLSIGADKGRRR